MGLMMKELNSQISETWSHCWGICLALTRLPRGLGQKVLRLKHFCFWRVSIAIKIPSVCSGKGQSEVVTRCCDVTSSPVPSPF